MYNAEGGPDFAMKVELKERPFLIIMIAVVLLSVIAAYAFKMTEQ